MKTFVFYVKEISARNYDRVLTHVNVRKELDGQGEERSPGEAVDVSKTLKEVLKS